jgi:hypothetical protein
MKRRVLILLTIFMLIAVTGLAEKNKKQFDLHILVPSKFSYIGMGPVSPINRYIEGYSKGFREALEKFRDKREMTPEKVSGWGEFISGHYDGFINASSQLRQFKKEMNEKEIIDLINSHLEPE